MTRKTAQQLLEEARAGLVRLEPHEAAARDALLVDTRDDGGVHPVSVVEPRGLEP